jgi:alpha-L-fucosidase 2
MNNVLIAGLILFAPPAFAGFPSLVWTNHANRAADSIPAGNGDIGVNVWTEDNGDLLLYIGKTDAFDESGRLLKLGRLRVKFSPALATLPQELKLRDGIIQLGTGIRIWVDANNPVIHIEAEAGKPFEQTVTLEMWRTEKKPLAHQWDKHAVDGMSASEPPLQYPDTVANVPNQIVWYHRNETSLHPVTLKLQELDPLKCPPDPLLGRTFGAAVAGKGFVSMNPTTLKTSAPVKSTHITIRPLTTQGSAESWVKEVIKPVRSDFDTHRRWWNKFWERSWVRVSGANTNETAAITLGWHVNRYLTACTARGNAPVKFNGAIFNVDGIDANGSAAPALNADARAWGPGFWFQNQRHIYWPMLAAGDYDQFAPFFKMYRDALPLALHRTQKYYRHDGAFFPETMYLWGTYLNGDCGYGWNRTGKELGLTDNGYIRRYWQGGLELTAMMLEYYQHTGDRQFARETLLPIATQIITFYDQHYKRDAAGKIRFEPAQMLETIWDVVNPMPEIAGLNCCLTGLLDLPGATEAQRAQWKRLLSELPPLPLTKAGDTTILGLADEIRGGKHNLENGHLYAVWPYRQHGVGVGNLKLAQDSYAHRWHKGGPYQCWINDTIFAAYCGLANEATDHLAYRFIRTDRLRFPAMYTHGDWVPDLDNGGVCQNTIQSMLMQTVGRKIYLLPAWPSNWNCDFKLHAPFDTVVSGKVQQGKLLDLEVQPASRRKDVVTLPAQP